MSDMTFGSTLDPSSCYTRNAENEELEKSYEIKSEVFSSSYLTAMEVQTTGSLLLKLDQDEFCIWCD